jgi:hypothetical protein
LYVCGIEEILQFCLRHEGQNVQLNAVTRSLAFSATRK